MDVLGYIPVFATGVAELIVPIQQDQPDLQDIPGFYQNGTGNFWVALDGGRVVGTIALKDIGNAQAALRKMFVAQSHRGKKFGVAKELLDTLLGHARMVGLSDIFLGTTDAFKAAHRFYEKYGFEDIDANDLPQNFPRMAVDTRFYRLPVEKKR